MVEDLVRWLVGDRPEGLWMAMSTGNYVLLSTAPPSTILPGSQFKGCGFTLGEHMNSRICRCCGEPMPEKGNALSRNPNICASCSSMADGMEETSVREGASHAPGQEPTPESTGANAPYRFEEKRVGAAAHLLPM